ncbi:carbohydrate ABC transporter permease [Lederbergia wuyishanensis]|uniref:Multiple sugar transport system permease protein n=1 Tax=Lederbergia wuyishanensis TaxID=1347903 RepID=A0ABU0DA62_9BACI|nr:carbohydrate ABC transporter permease [Lederbergia wuyishanensis]MCJ8009944.1 carbohydrate ABC transporter permease [Lederbergia wuyishanensis]MDQ0345291.1 multiple sugar transport system permease protein [Lederbergia wuyishanensis]
MERTVLEEKSIAIKKVNARKERHFSIPFEKIKSMAWTLVRSVLIIGLSFVILYPIILKVSIAFKHKSDLYDPNVMYIPRHFTLENFKYVMESMNYFKVVWNSFLLSGSTMLLTTISCALVGYGFARFKFRGNNILFALVILTILVPPQTIMVPTYLQYRNFDVFGIIGLFNGGEGIKLLGTFWPFIISSATAMGLKAGLFIFIFRQFFKGVPREIEEAALVDGAGVFKIFFRIMLPNAIPAIITVMLFSFVWQWNDTYFTTMFLESASVISSQVQIAGATIASKLTAASGSGQIDPFYLSMLVNTSVLLAITPLIVLYMFVQRHFVESVERTGIVG